MTGFRHDDRDARRRREGTIIGDRAQDVGARLVELHLSRDLAISRQRRREPDRRPGRVGSCARVLPRFDLSRLEHRPHQPRDRRTMTVQAQVLANRDSVRRREEQSGRQSRRHGGGVSLALIAPAAADGGRGRRGGRPNGPSACARRARRARNSSRLRAFGMPSSAIVGDERDRFADLGLSRFFGPDATVGGLLERIVGLLVPAPSAPVSDALTMSSIR